MVRKTDLNTARIEKKLDQIFEALGSSSSTSNSNSKIDVSSDSTSLGREDADSPLDRAIHAKPKDDARSPPVVFDLGNRRETSSSAVVGVDGVDRIRDHGRRERVSGGGDGTIGDGSSSVGAGHHQISSDGGRPRREENSGPDLDEFIDQYHAEVKDR